MEAMIVRDEQPMQQSGFDYSQLDEQPAKLARRRAQEIHWLSGSAIRSMVEIGVKLIEVRDQLLPTGHWRSWLMAEFEWSQVRANQLIRLAEVFGDLDLANTETSLNALTLVSLSRLPQSIRDQARQKIIETNILTIEDAQGLVETVDPEIAAQFAPSYWRKKGEQNRYEAAAAELKSSAHNLQIILVAIHGSPLPTPISRGIQRLFDLADDMVTEGKRRTSMRDHRIGFRDTKTPQSKSRFYGVTWSEKHKRWIAQHQPLGTRRNIYLGRYLSEEEAARAVDAKCRELYGDKAKLNFPDEGV